MKRVLCLVLILVCCMTSLYVFADDETNSQNYTLGLNTYLNTDNDNYLLRNNNYGHYRFIQEFQEDLIVSELLNTVDHLINCGSKPDVKKYTEVLVNIMATYEMENASDIAEQRKKDNLKNAKDYAMDLVEISSNAVSFMVDINEDKLSDFEKWISTAVSGLSTLAGNIDNWIETLSNLETIIQNYSAYDDFLKLIEENAEGDLKIAASTLRTSMKKAMQLKLESYNGVLEENYKNYEEYFFSDLFFNSLELIAKEEADESLMLLADFGSEVIGAVSGFKTAWDLGVGIGKLVGNVAVGGEDLVNRLLETMAIKDISNILIDELSTIASEYKPTGKDSEEVAKLYFEYSKYLVGCRIRGEYCLYSIVACDAGLLSWFNKENAEEAKSWYDQKSARIMEIRDSIENAGNVLLGEVENKGYEVGEKSEWYIYDAGGSLCRNYTLHITNKEKMHVGAIVDEEFEEQEYIVDTAKPLTLTLECGWWYSFEIIDNLNPENQKWFTVAVTKSSEDNINMVDIVEVETEFSEFKVDVKDYLHNLNGLATVVEMEKVDSVTNGFGFSNNYQLDKFEMTFDVFDDIVFMMRNEGNNDVTLFDISLGDSIDVVKQKLHTNGGFVCYDSVNFANEKEIEFLSNQNEWMQMILKFDKNDKIIGWWICNFFEGENGGISTEQILEIENSIADNLKLDWQQAYIEYIKYNGWQAYTGNYSGELYKPYEYYLAYINDDEIPELIVCKESNASGSQIYTYINGRVEVLYIEIYSANYIEKENLILEDGGSGGVYDNNIYSIEKDGFVRIHHAYYEEIYPFSTDENGEILYKYFWDDKEVSKDEYYDSLNSAYNMSKNIAVRPNDMLNVIEILNQIFSTEAEDTTNNEFINTPDSIIQAQAGVNSNEHFLYIDYSLKEDGQFNEISVNICDSGNRSIADASQANLTNGNNIYGESLSVWNSPYGYCAYVIQKDGSGKYILNETEILNLLDKYQIDVSSVPNSGRTE